MKTYPKISIVTPNFNGAAYLEDTIQSVLSQGYPNLEYIIIDGGSADGSVEIIKKYQDKLAYWISEKDNGLYSAVQKGFEKSTGELMAWINSDDMYSTKSFFVVAEIFAKFSQVNWLMGMPSAYDEQGRIIRIDRFKRWSKFDYYLGEYEWIQQESVFWRRSLWETAGAQLATHLKLAGDLELWTRFFRHEKLYTIDALLSGFRIRSTQQLSYDHIEDYHKEVQQVLTNERLNYVSKEDLELVKKIKRHQELGAKRHHLIRFFHNYALKQLKKKHFKYPPLFYFNRNRQSFEMLNE